jgi:uncharacterized membrane protein YfcA
VWAFTDVLILLGVGAIGGLLAGMLGIGGGLIYITAFTYYLGNYDLSSAEFVRLILANSIFAVFFAGVSGTIRQMIQGTFYFRETLITAIPGTLGALLFSYILTVSDWYTQDKFSLLVLALLLVLAYRMFRPQKANNATNALVMDDLPAKQYALSGFFSGVLSAVSGFGGGIVLIPVLSGFMRLNIRLAASISLGIMPFYTLAMIIFYGLRHGNASLDIPGTFGYLLFPMVLPLAAGVVVCTPLGVWLAQKIPRKVLQLIFGILIVVVSSQVILEHLF